VTAPKAAARIAGNLPFLDAAGAVRHGPIPRSRSLPLMNEGGRQQAEDGRQKAARSCGIRANPCNQCQQGQTEHGLRGC
jgi:hypothetical protein